jgi:uncharacterized protein YjbJ (UPF0337 family)
MTMSNQMKRVEGTAKEVGGKIQQKVGQVIGNEKMEAEGRVNELKGKATKESAKAAERVKGTAEEVKGAVKRTVGAALDNEDLEARGMAEQKLGQARQATNR